jgi:ABC-type phosphate transport system permease subunit
MAKPWERPFVAAARFFALCVTLTPFGVVAVVAAAGLAGQQESKAALFLGGLIAALVATLIVAIIAAGIGATVGIGTALLTQELVSSGLRAATGMSVTILAAFPAVVLGWFGAMLVLPLLPGRAQGAVFAAAVAVVTVAVIPRANLLAMRTLSALPASAREAAAAAGAAPGRIAAFVTLPACARSLIGVYADAFSRAVGEAAAVAIVLSTAERAGYPVSVVTLPSAVMLQARSMQAIHAGIAQSALLILALAAISKTIAARRIGRLL